MNYDVEEKRTLSTVEVYPAWWERIEYGGSMDDEEDLPLVIYVDGPDGVDEGELPF